MTRVMETGSEVLIAEMPGASGMVEIPSSCAGYVLTLEARIAMLEAELKARDEADADSALCRREKMLSTIRATCVSLVGALLTGFAAGWFARG